MNLDSAQGIGGWPARSRSRGHRASSPPLCYPSSDLIYARTSSGQVYRLARSAGSWTATAIRRRAAAVASGSGTSSRSRATQHVFVGAGGLRHRPRLARRRRRGRRERDLDRHLAARRRDRVPDVPVNSLAVDPDIPRPHLRRHRHRRSSARPNGGTRWDGFSSGLPEHRRVRPAAARADAAASRGHARPRPLGAEARRRHRPGRGALPARPPMSTGRIVPTPAPGRGDARGSAPARGPRRQALVVDVRRRQGRRAGGAITHAYQLPVAAVDYLAFETRLAHRQPAARRANRVYVQVHNRGIADAVERDREGALRRRGARAAEPPERTSGAPSPATGRRPSGSRSARRRRSRGCRPSAPRCSSGTGPRRTTAATHTCLLVVVDCAQRPDSRGEQGLQRSQRSSANERRVGLKNVHPVGVLPDPSWTDFRLYLRGRDELRFRGWPPGWQIGLLLPPKTLERAELVGARRGKLTKIQRDTLEQFLRRSVTADELRGFVVLGDGKEGARSRVCRRAREGTAHCCCARRRAAPGTARSRSSSASARRSSEATPSCCSGRSSRSYPRSSSSAKARTGSSLPFT